MTMGNIIARALIFLGPGAQDLRSGLAVPIGIVRVVTRAVVALLLVLSLSALLMKPPPSIDDLRAIATRVGADIQTTVDADFATRYSGIDPERLTVKADRDGDTYWLEASAIEGSGDDAKTVAYARFVEFERLIPSIPATGFGAVDVAANLVDRLTGGLTRITFGATPYSVSTILAATATRPLNPLDEREMRATVDAVVIGPEAERNIPRPGTEALAMHRRLGGWIQFVCLYLFAYAIVLMIGIWATTLLPSAVLRSSSTLNVPNIRSYRYAAADSTPVTRILADDEAAPGNMTVETGTIGSPFGHTKLIASPERIADMYGAAGWAMREQLGGTYGQVKLPATELRRVAYRALQTDPTGASAPNYVSVEADSIYELFESYAKPVSFLVWAIPTLGFVGTVVGIGQALGATVDIQSVQTWQRVLAESQVSSLIGLAFDTTLVALLLSFVLMFLSFWQQGRQDGLVATEKRSTLEHTLRSSNIYTSAPVAASATTSAPAPV